MAEANLPFIRVESNVISVTDQASGCMGHFDYSIAGDVTSVVDDLSPMFVALSDQPLSVKRIVVSFRYTLPQES